MSVVVEFTTVPEMFDRITTKYATERRPILMKKVWNEYRAFRSQSTEEKSSDLFSASRRSE
jgi:hypothetical protein